MSKVRIIQLRRGMLREIINEEIYSILLEQDEDADEADSAKSKEVDDEPDNTETTLNSTDDDEEPGTRMSKADLNHLLGFIVKYIQDLSADIRKRRKREKDLKIVTSAVVEARDEADDSDEDVGVIILDDERDRDRLLAVRAELKNTNLSREALESLGDSIVRR